jgi:membrane-associated protease RseP (regulator of RpoE activity)
VIELRDGHIALQMALKEAEHALQGVKSARPLSVEQEELAAALRVEIDSINLALAESYALIRVQTDSLAARTLRVKPAEMPDIPDLGVTVTGPDERTVVIYSDAVAGARFKMLDGEKAEYFQVESGLLIVEVVEDTPAYNAGLREFDVVTAVNGEPIGTVDEFRRLIRSGRVELTFVRKGEEKTCEIGGD